MTSPKTEDHEWKEAFSASAHATVFGDARYLRAMAEASALEPRFLLGDGCGAAVCGRRRGPLRECALPLFTPFSAISLPDLDEARIHKGTDALSRVADLLEAGFDRIRIHLPPTVKDVRPLSLRGWRVSPLYTYVLRPEEGTAGWSSGTKRSVRKHVGDYETAVDANAVSDVIRLVHEGYTRNGATPPGNPALLGKAVEYLFADGLVECVTARRAGILEAGIVLLHGREASYYWMAGSQPGPAMSVLIAFVLEHLKDREVAVFDLLGANTPPIAEFKRRLGAQLVQYWSATCDRSHASRAISAVRTLQGR